MIVEKDIASLFCEWHILLCDAQGARRVERIVMAGLHCVDCVFATIAHDGTTGLCQGRCSRGYTLADPHVHTAPDMFFAANPEALVPVVDPLGREYLRTKNVCESYMTPQDAIAISEAGEVTASKTSAVAQFRRAASRVAASFI